MEAVQFVRIYHQFDSSVNCVGILSGVLYHDRVFFLNSKCVGKANHSGSLDEQPHVIFLPLLARFERPLGVDFHNQPGEFVLPQGEVANGYVVPVLGHSGD